MGDKKIEKRLSIVTFNTLGTPFFAPDITKRYIKIAQLLNEGDYDIICLQELFSYYHLFLFKKYLTNFSYVIYQKNLFGPKGGLVIFSKVELVNKNYHTYTLPKNTYIPFYTYLSQPGFLSAVIKSLGIRIATTHLSSDNVSNLSPKNKLYKLIQNQSKEAAEEVNRYTKKGDPFILVGDFNIAKHNPLQSNFVKQTALKDIFISNEEATYEPTRIKYFYKAPAGRVDFMYVKTQNGHVKTVLTENILTQQETLSNGKKSYLSDHIGLHCILGVNEY